MAAMTFHVTGFDRLRRQLERAAQGAQAEIQRALHAEGEIEMTEMKRRTPVLTDALRASGHFRSRISGRDVTGEWRFGGPAAPYAVFVHENMEAFHGVGQAKFVESVLNESVPFLARRIAARMSMIRIFGHP